MNKWFYCEGSPPRHSSHSQACAKSPVVLFESNCFVLPVWKKALLRLFWHTFEMFIFDSGISFDIIFWHLLIYWHSFWPLIFYCLPGRFPPGPQKHPIHMNLFFQISMSKLLTLGTPVFPASKRCWKTPPWMKGPCCIRELPKVNAELFT